MKALVENNTIVRFYGELPTDWKHYLNFKMAEPAVIEEEGFYDVVTPAVNETTQRLGEPYFDIEKKIVTYEVINKTQEEITNEQLTLLEKLAEQNETKIDWKLIKKLLVDEKLKTITDDAQAIEYRTLYQPYRVGIELEKGVRFYYPLNDKLYEVVQKHTTQLHYKPDEVITLYKEVPPPGVIAAWVQPLGAGYEYELGEKVTHNGKTWISVVVDNVWEPGVYGWDEIK